MYFYKKNAKIFGQLKKKQYLCTRFWDLCSTPRGAIAQLVEQRTENPCVPGSIPGGTTNKKTSKIRSLFIFHIRLKHYNAATYFSASIAALHPLAAATIAWR